MRQVRTQGLPREPGIYRRRDGALFLKVNDTGQVFVADALGMPTEWRREALEALDAMLWEAVDMADTILDEIDAGPYPPEVQDEAEEDDFEEDEEDEEDCCDECGRPF